MTNKIYLKNEENLTILHIGHIEVSAVQKIKQNGPPRER
jgi:hypothetical protein